MVSFGAMIREMESVSKSGEPADFRCLHCASQPLHFAQVAAQLGLAVAYWHGCAAGPTTHWRISNQRQEDWPCLKGHLVEPSKTRASADII